MIYNFKYDINISVFDNYIKVKIILNYLKLYSI